MYKIYQGRDVTGLEALYHKTSVSFLNGRKATSQTNRIQRKQCYSGTSVLGGDYRQATVVKQIGGVMHVLLKRFFPPAMNVNVKKSDIAV